LHRDDGSPSCSSSLRTPALGGHVLVFPGEYSHWFNMRNIMEELVRRNHSVTVLVGDASPSVDYNNSRYAAKFNFLVFKLHRLSLPYKIQRMSDWIRRSFQYALQQCDSMLKNEQLMATLRASKFDAVLLDPMMMCGDLVANVLGLPFILSLRFSFGSIWERHCGQVPAPPSFVPPSPLIYTDRMTFKERLVSVLTYVWLSVTSEVLWSLSLRKDTNRSPFSFCESLGNADIWLFRTFWDVETPRPTVPNFKRVGGLHCKPANQLPEDLEAFVQSSGNAGGVVASFGSMVTNLTTETVDVIAAAFGQIPQKVRTNTKVIDWIPQNDLLGTHTHGGTNGLYEVIYHAVPLVGIPLFADQHSNLAQVGHQGAAIVLDFNHFTSDELTEALQAVIDQPSYKSTMQRLSALHHDRPMTPLNTAVFWVEFVMRHGGAHLRLASRDLNWFQYDSVDTGLALLVVMAITTVICWRMVHCFLRCCYCSRQRREKED
uniref:UDP glucuronosyltransferase 2 family, polypeptide A4 n=1 Tax=Mola mola TaxID=94237 RepID=A0A3Q3XGL0_MOLML